LGAKQGEGAAVALAREQAVGNDENGQGEKIEGDEGGVEAAEEEAERILDFVVVEKRFARAVGDAEDRGEKIALADGEGGGGCGREHGEAAEVGELETAGVAGIEVGVEIGRRRGVELGGVGAGGGEFFGGEGLGLGAGGGLEAGLRKTVGEAVEQSGGEDERGQPEGRVAADVAPFESEESFHF
jgi:hypothetical protein